MDKEEKIKQFTREADKIRESITEFQTKYPKAKPMIINNNIVWEMDIDKL